MSNDPVFFVNEPPEVDDVRQAFLDWCSGLVSGVLDGTIGAVEGVFHLNLWTEKLGPAAGADAVNEVSVGDDGVFVDGFKVFERAVGS